MWCVENVCEERSTYHSVPRALSFLPARESRFEPEPEAAAAAEAKLDGICEGILILISLEKIASRLHE